MKVLKLRNHLPFRVQLVYSELARYSQYNKGCTRYQVQKLTGLHYRTTGIILDELVRLEMATRNNGEFTAVESPCWEWNEDKPHWYQRAKYWKFDRLPEFTLVESAVYWLVANHKKSPIKTKSRLAKKLGFSKRQVIRAVAKLTTSGLIRQDGDGFHAVSPKAEIVPAPTAAAPLESPKPKAKADTTSAPPRIAPLGWLDGSATKAERVEVEKLLGSLRMTPAEPRAIWDGMVMRHDPAKAGNRPSPIKMFLDELRQRVRVAEAECRQLTGLSREQLAELGNQAEFDLEYQIQNPADPRILSFDVADFFTRRWNFSSPVAALRLQNEIEKRLPPMPRNERTSKAEQIIKTVLVQTPVNGHALPIDDFWKKVESQIETGEDNTTI